MKKKRFTLIFVLCFVLILSGCAGNKDAGINIPQAGEGEIVYSDLSEETDLEYVKGLLSDSGISDERIGIFEDHVKQFNEIMKPEELTAGFEAADPKSPKYDAYELQDRWDKSHPEFMGYNCRITAFSLFGDYIDIPDTAEGDGDMVIFDLSSLDADPSAFPDEIEKFKAFYNAVPTEPSKDIAVHADNMKKYYEDKGIKFRDNSSASLVSVVFNENDGEKDYLFTGHTGLLVEAPDGRLMFIEKLAFQEPYQCVCFNSRGELSKYLMDKYNLDYNQPTAEPFIMENNNLMEDQR